MQRVCHAKKKNQNASKRGTIETSSLRFARSKPQKKRHHMGNLAPLVPQKKRHHMGISQSSCPKNVTIWASRSARAPKTCHCNSQARFVKMRRLKIGSFLYRKSPQMVSISNNLSILVGIDNHSIRRQRHFFSRRFYIKQDGNV